MRVAADIRGMRADIHVIEDLPPVVIERRRQKDRRTTWRGGRRDSDWLERPPGALTRMTEPTGWGQVWRRWRSLTTLFS
jgi:hypothetical protein